MPKATKPVAATASRAASAASATKAKPAPAKRPVSTKTTTGAKTTTASTKTTTASAKGGPSSSSSSAAPAASAKRSSGRKPAEAEAPVVDKFLQEQRTLLLTERETYVQQAESLRAEAEQLAADMEPGDIQFDEESGEGGTMNIERERDLALSAQARAAVDEIDRALAKVDAGTYGICERCGEPIKKARLKALPYASLCIECKSGGLSRR